MRLWFNIAELLATTTGISCRCRRLFGLSVVLLGIGPNLVAQEIDVHNAVISIPEGVTITTNGGIRLEGEGAIFNNGTLEVGGNWTNNGKGLLPKGRGTVVLKGENQSIGGAHSTQFHDLSLVGKGKKQLFADVAVDGRLRMENCAVITHQHGFAISGLDPRNFDWTNAIVISEENVVSVSENLQFETASFPHSNGVLSFFTNAAISASGPHSSRTRASSSASQNGLGTKCQRPSNEFLNAALVPQVSNEKSSNGLRCAIQTMYFCSEMDGENSIKNELNWDLKVCYCTLKANTTSFENSLITTRKLDLGSVPASSFLVEFVLNTHQA